MPLTVDLDSGAYVHPERGTAVVGGTDTRPSALDRTIDEARRERLIDALVHRFPHLAGAELMRGWVGCREMTPDDHALVGPVPAAPGYWVVAGFSGHGFMHAPVIGREVARWLTKKARRRWIFSALAPNRFAGARTDDEAYVF